MKVSTVKAIEQPSPCVRLGVSTTFINCQIQTLAVHILFNDIKVVVVVVDILMVI